MLASFFVLQSGCATKPSQVAEAVPKQQKPRQLIRILRRAPGWGFEDAAMKLDSNDLVGDYGLGAGFPGADELCLYPLGIFVETYSGCIGPQRSVTGSWTLEESGVVLEPCRSPKNPDSATARLIPALLDGRLDLVASEHEAEFVLAGPTPTNHYVRVEKPRYWTQVLNRQKTGGAIHNRRSTVEGF